MDRKLAEFEEQLNDKASKQSVAQALHRKINKQDIEDQLAKKVEQHELQRIYATLDLKVDSNIFENLSRAVE